MPRKARRAQLLESALDVFVAQGYHAAAMDDIAERAGVSKPVLYQHFPGKLELYLALLDQSCDTIIDATREALASHTVVFLNVGLSDTVKRVGLGVGRPLLLGNVRSRVKALLDERLPVYRSVAVLTVETDGRTPEEVADTVAAFVETSSVVDG